MLELPRISIITPFHSEPLEMLEVNLESVRIQKTHYEFEHIVVCDNPNRHYDSLQELTSSKGTKVVFPKKNLGLPEARNFGIDNSSGNYIMLLDADDRFASGRIQTQIDFMQKHELAHCYGGYQEWHWGNSKPEEQVIIPPQESPLAYLKDLNNVCYCGSNCFKKKIYYEIGGFDKNLNGLGAEDLEFWLRISANGYSVKCLPKVLYYLGVHSNNMCARYIKGGQFDKAYEYIKQKHGLYV